MQFLGSWTLHMQPRATSKTLHQRKQLRGDKIAAAIFVLVRFLGLGALCCSPLNHPFPTCVCVSGLALHSCSG